jgi:hypothetical protein
MKKTKNYLYTFVSNISKRPVSTLFVIACFLSLGTVSIAAATPIHTQTFATFSLGDPSGQYYCGSQPKVAVSIDFGCEGKGNPVVDIVFAIIRFLSAGVGIAVVASLVWAGVQYTASRGDPAATAKAVERMRNTVIALIAFIFLAALLDYVIPTGFLNL